MDDNGYKLAFLLAILCGVAQAATQQLCQLQSRAWKTLFAPERHRGCYRTWSRARAVLATLDLACVQFLSNLSVLRNGNRWGEGWETLEWDRCRCGRWRHRLDGPTFDFRLVLNHNTEHCRKGKAVCPGAPTVLSYLPEDLQKQQWGSTCVIVRCDEGGIDLSPCAASFVIKK
jgi:hypothetical protein